MTYVQPAEFQPDRCRKADLKAHFSYSATTLPGLRLLPDSSALFVSPFSARRISVPSILSRLSWRATKPLISKILSFHTIQSIVFTFKIDVAVHPRGATLPHLSPIHRSCRIDLL
jgi:hypothetical protein